MPIRLAASTMSVPFGTVTEWPSMVSVARLGSFCGGASGMCELAALHAALITQAVLLVLLAEALHRPLDDPAGGVAEAAQTAAGRQAGLHTVEEREVGARAVAGQHPVVGAHGPVAAHAAGRALAAGLVRVELHQPVGHAHDAARVVG